MSKWALITGASVGIGESFSRLLASQGYNLIINARDEAKLNERAASLREQYKVEVVVLAADLSTDCERVESYIKGHQIDVLINNAGFGINQSFLASDITDEQRVLDVLVRAPMRLTHCVLPQMKERGSGIVLNVSSVASFIAGGHYSAAKAFITVLSESLHTELQGSGVSVTALCPGFTHTEFHQRAGMKMGRLPKFLWLDVDPLVVHGWSDARKGRAVSVPGWQYKVLQFVIAATPRRYVRRMGVSLRSKQR
jgi:short-subunit dehydrogenase